MAARGKEENDHFICSIMSGFVPLPEDLPGVLEQYLPRGGRCGDNGRDLPFVTLTYAQSVDSKIAARPGTRTHISHAETKTMTHYLRVFHDAILVGVKTVLADDPSLNCRYPARGAGSAGGTGGDFSIRPVVVDPGFRLEETLLDLKMVHNYRSGAGLKPIIVVAEEVHVPVDLTDVVDILHLPTSAFNRDSGKCVFQWAQLLETLKRVHRLESVMIEGGAHIINTLLSECHPTTGTPLVDSLIVTIGPVYLGKDGVGVSPASPLTLKNVRWWTGVQDSVMCATMV